jgi:hypothetical protein
MSRESMRGISQEKEVYALTRKIASNVAFMTKEDIKVLEYLATKGDYSDKVIKLVDKKYVPFISEVEEFNAVMGKPNNYEPIIPERKEWEFVYNFVLEELEEYREACEGGDIVEILDALCDITYVAVGNGAMLHGIKDKVWEAYQEVQASNLSKACKTEEEAQATVDKRSIEQGEACHYEKVGPYYIVYRTRDKKVMKNVNYFRPDLSKFFTEEQLSNFNRIK